MQDNYKGYSLFNEVLDVDLQRRNRAVVMSNMFEDNPDNSNKESTSKTGALLIFGYMASVPEGDRAKLATEFHEQMKTRGYHKS